MAAYSNAMDSSPDSDSEGDWPDDRDNDLDHFPQFPNFPAEIQDMIVKAYCDDATTGEMATSALVSRFFHAVVQRSLYREITLGNPGVKKLPLLLRTFSTRKDLARMVEKVFINVMGGCSPTPLTDNEIKSIVAALPYRLTLLGPPSAWERDLQKGNFSTPAALITWFARRTEVFGLRVPEKGGTISGFLRKMIESFFCGHLGISASHRRLREVSFQGGRASDAVATLHRVMSVPTLQHLTIPIAKWETSRALTGPSAGHLRALHIDGLVLFASGLVNDQRLLELLTMVPNVARLELHVEWSGYSMPFGTRQDRIDLAHWGRALRALRSLVLLEIKVFSGVQYSWRRGSALQTIIPLGDLANLTSLEILRVPWWALRPRLSTRSNLATILPNSLRELVLRDDLASAADNHWTKARRMAFRRSNLGAAANGPLPNLNVVKLRRNKTPV